jgi:hypothetical protein
MSELRRIFTGLHARTGGPENNVETTGNEWAGICH